MGFFSIAAKAEHATLSVTAESSCSVLYAGQTIDAGDVCVTTDGTDLTVTYTTYGGWELKEAHLWIGETVDGYPQARNGNPKVGNFPYNSGDITGSTSHSFTVPIASVTDLFDDLHLYCDVAAPSLYMMAHAAVQLPDGTGGYQTETGWSDGSRVMERGSWATLSTLNFSVICEDTPPPPPSNVGQETAWMFGSDTFDSLANCGDDGIRGTSDDGTPDLQGTTVVSKAWGWSDGPIVNGETRTQEFWAAAGQNDLTKGSYVGDVTIEHLGDVVRVTIQMFEGYTLVENQIFVGNAHTCTKAPGQLGYNGDVAGNPHVAYITPNDEWSAGEDVYVAVHGNVEAECNSNGNFCE